MSDSCNPDSTTGKAIRRKLQKGAKYNYDFVQVASRMVAAGMTEKEIGYWLGVKPTTISKWKQRYAEFKLATDSKSSAKKIAAAHMVANGLRSAIGYDFEEVDQVLKRIKNPDWDENHPDETEEYILLLEKETRKLRHRPPDKDLLMFFLLNLSDEYHNTKSIQIEQTKKQINVNITGQLESSDIRKLAGAAFKQADQIERRCQDSEHPVIEAEIVEPNKSKEANETFLESLVDAD